MNSSLISSFLNQHIATEWQLEPLPGGVVNQSWRVVTPRGQYFLKYQPRLAHNGVNRIEEIRLQRALNNSHLSVNIAAWNSSYELVLYDWVEAPTLAQLDSLTQVEVLAQTLARIHQQQPELPSWSLQHRVDNYLQAVAQYDPAVANPLAVELSHYKPLIQQWDDGPKVLCHNDLSYAHILLATPAKVVDWEYAGYGDPGFDIASAIEINQLSESAAQRLCALYVRHSGIEISLDEVQHWCRLIALINRLWDAAQVAQRPQEKQS